MSLRRRTSFLLILAFYSLMISPELSRSAENLSAVMYLSESSESGESTTNKSLLDKRYGDEPFELGQERTSDGLLISYTTEDPDLLAIDGNIATIRGAGTTVVTAATDETVDEQTEQVVTIQPSVLEINADGNQAKIYGESDPQLTYSAEGFVYDDDYDLITGSLSREAGEDTGEYDITRGDLSAGGNYSIQFRPADFEIQKRELDVTVERRLSKTYGEPDPYLAYSVSNFAEGDDKSILSGELSREAGEDAGVYAILAEGLDAGSNYNIRFQPAELTILQRSLMLDTFTAEDKIYDGSPNARDANFRDNRLSGDDLEFSYTAQFENPDAETNKTVIFSDIEISGGSDRQNYILNSTKGAAQATIFPRPVTVQALPVEMTYGDEEPALKYRISEGSIAEGDRLDGQLTRTGSQGAGEYEIQQGSLTAGGNYDISFEPAEFSITPRTLQVVVDGGQSKIYGEADPELTFEARNFAPGEDIEILSGSISRGNEEDVGSYPIKQNTLSAGRNYEIEFSSAEFEIKPKELLVEVIPHQTKLYGSGDPEIRFRATGFAFNDSETLLTGSPSRKSGEDVGFYYIQKGSLDAGTNYKIKFEPVEFEIMPRPLMLTNFKAGDKTYDGTSDVSGTDFQDNRVDGDKLEFDYHAAFERSDAGQDLLVHFTDIDIAGGEDQNNYKLQTTSWSVLADIKPRKLTVAARPVEIVYGDEEPEELEYKVTNGSLLEDDEFRGVLQRTGTENAGKYEIRQGTLTAGENYKIKFKPAAYLVKPKELTVTANGELWKFEGENDPEVPYKAVGFEYGDDRTIIDGSLEREQGETHGEYTILRGTLDAGPNYNILMENAVFSIFRTPPVAVQQSPVPDETRIETDAPITVQFDHSILLANADLISVTDPESRGIEFRVEAEGDHLRLIHDGLNNHTTYTVTIRDEALVNLDGIPSEEILWQFTTVMPPPVVDTHSPSDGAVGVGFTRPPVASFTQKVNAGNLAGITITRQDDGSVHDVEAALKDNQLIIEHGQFEQFADYRVSIPANAVRNADDVGNTTYSWTFTTIWAQPEQVALQLPIDSKGSVELQPTLEWKPALHAESYQVQVSSDIEFTQAIADSEVQDGLSYELPETLDYNQRYFWRIMAKNSTSRSEWSDERSFITIAETPDVVFPIADASQVSIAPLLEWSSAYNTTFRIQLSQSGDFSAPVIDKLTNDTSLQLTGLEDDELYYWRVRVENERTKSDWNLVSAFSTRPAPQIAGETDVLREQIEFGKSTVKAKNDLSDREYRLVGLPGGDQYSVSDLFEGNYGTDWKAFRKVGTDDVYREYSQSDKNFTFSSGGGFWVSGTNTLNIELPVAGVETNENDAYTVPLHPGWNIISNPHTKNVSWRDVRVMNGIHGEVYSYNGHFAEADTLHSVYGYYYYNPPETALDALEIPYSGMENRRKIDNKGELLNAASLGTQPTVKLHAEFNEEKRLANELLFPGLAENHSDFEEDVNRLKKYHPPMAMSRTGMMLIKPEYENSKGMIRDVSEYNRQGSEYHLHMKADKGSVFTWRAEIADMPENTSLLLVNEESDQSWMLRHGETVEAVMEKPEMIYTLFVGDKYWLEQKEREYLPQDFALFPNYPNPFNAATTIRYSLPEKQNVRLEIYDVIGRRVQVLINDEQPAGWYTMRFDASRLASGVYIYQMTTENNVTSRKMTIVK
ncbi:MBG domain-containing protein [Rhodohalobacter sp. 8-1]|uniref:MBG domain-containing protein n=1 Tax=Rhodohalobacter sp. 8-1 TaxID=3131972 RepID=UPI0030ED7355